MMKLHSALINWLHAGLLVLLCSALAVGQTTLPKYEPVVVSANELLQDPFRYQGKMIFLDCQIMASVMDGATLAEVPYPQSPIPSMNALSYQRMLDPNTALFTVRGNNVRPGISQTFVTLGQIAVSIDRKRIPRDQVPPDSQFSFKGLSTEGGWLIEPLGTLEGKNAAGGPVVVPHIRFWGFRTATTAAVNEDTPGRSGLLGREFKSYEEMETWKALNGRPPKLEWEGWKDRGEYDLYKDAMHAQDLTKKLNLLKAWRANYPRSNFLAERYRKIQETEAALAAQGSLPSPQKVLTAPSLFTLNPSNRPEYTQDAIDECLVGTVVVNATVDENGDVTNASIARMKLDRTARCSILPGGDGPQSAKGLDDSALRAVRTLKFIPATIHETENARSEEKVAVNISVEYQFWLDEKSRYRGRPASEVKPGERLFQRVTEYEGAVKLSSIKLVRGEAQHQLYPR